MLNSWTVDLVEVDDTVKRPPTVKPRIVIKNKKLETHVFNPIPLEQRKQSVNFSLIRISTRP